MVSSHEKKMTNPCDWRHAFLVYTRYSPRVFRNLMSPSVGELEDILSLLTQSGSAPHFFQSDAVAEDGWVTLLESLYTNHQ